MLEKTVEALTRNLTRTGSGMSTHKEEILAELDRVVQSIGRDWMGDLIDCHNYDQAMAQLTVVETIAIWCENINPKQLLDDS